MYEDDLEKAWSNLANGYGKGPDIAILTPRAYYYIKAKFRQQLNPLGYDPDWDEFADWVKAEREKE